MNDLRPSFYKFIETLLAWSLYLSQSFTIAMNLPSSLFSWEDLIKIRYPCIIESLDIQESFFSQQIFSAFLRFYASLFFYMPLNNISSI